MRTLDRLKVVRHIVLDMDGTIYLGGRVLDCTLPFLAWLRARGIGYTFVTNNNSLSRRQYLQKLASIGIHAEPTDLFTSTDATVHHLRTALPKVRTLHVLGTAGLCEDLANAGYRIDDQPQAVVVGFDTGLSYDRLCRAAYWIGLGLPFIATHPDRVCPTDQPTVLPDCGSICALLQTATGRAPDAICGKPQPQMLGAVLDRHRLEPLQAAMVGDRIYTDMVMARNVGAMAVLVLSGETQRDQARDSGIVDLIVADLGELQQLLQQAHQDSRTASARTESR